MMDSFETFRQELSSKNYRRIGANGLSTECQSIVLDDLSVSARNYSRVDRIFSGVCVFVCVFVFFTCFLRKQCSNVAMITKLDV